MKRKVIAGIIVAVVLIFSYWWGADAPGYRGWTPESMQDKTETVQKEKKPEKKAPEKEEKEVMEEAPSKEVQEEQEIIVDVPTSHEAMPQEENGSLEYSENQGMEIDAETGRDKYNTEPVPENKPVPVEPENAEITKEELTCTLSVTCNTIFDNMQWLDPAKKDIVPKDGIIFAEQTVTFYEGESVFNLLKREMKRNKIHLEFVNTPMYNSAYIEGIGNLYEFDCGEMSGWIYKVNDWAPNYGCSRYPIKDGDRVEWVYTCDLGTDVRSFYGFTEEVSE